MKAILKREKSSLLTFAPISLDWQTIYQMQIFAEYNPDTLWSEDRIKSK